MTDTEDSSLSVMDQEETEMVINHDWNHGLHNILQILPSIAVLDVAVETVTK